MSTNSSLNVTLVRTYDLECRTSLVSNAIFITYTFSNILLLLPVYILILYMGFQRWRHSAPAGQTMSHSDCLTYHIVTVEILGILGSFIYCLGFFTDTEMLFLMGTYLYFVMFPGQTAFHLLTCVDHYLAVVHPITFMRLQTRGFRIRNVSISCAWLLCFGWMGMVKLYRPGFPIIPLICMSSMSVVAISFCCLSVLCVLTHPGPGEVGRAKERVDRSKQRALRIIMAIMGALLLRFFALLFGFGLFYLQLIDVEVACVLLDVAVCLTVPSSLVLPLLFLHKTGKLACCRNNTGSG